MSRQVYWLGSSIILVAFAFLLTDRLVYPRGVTAVNAERIRPGMSWEQVVMVLGGPPGDYRTGEVELDFSDLTPQWRFDNIMTSMEVLLGERRFRHEWWQGDEGTLWVCFDEQGRVVNHALTPAKPRRR